MDRARVVVIGGGITGCSNAYLLGKAQLDGRAAAGQGRPDQRIDLPRGRPGHDVQPVADPCFELGDTAQECEFDEERRAALCEAYFGRLDPVQLARMELLAFTADVGRTLWAAIQTKISDIDYDFWGWAEERWDRAVTLLDSHEFPRLVSQAANT